MFPRSRSYFLEQFRNNLRNEWRKKDSKEMMLENLVTPFIKKLDVTRK